MFCCLEQVQFQKYKLEVTQLIIDKLQHLYYRGESTCWRLLNAV